MLAEEDPTALDLDAPDRALFTASGAAAGGSRSTTSRAGAALVTLAYGVLAGGGVCARVDGRVVDLSALDPLFDAPR